MAAVEFITAKSCTASLGGAHSQDFLPAPFESSRHPCARQRNPRNSRSTTAQGRLEQEPRHAGGVSETLLATSVLFLRSCCQLSFRRLAKLIPAIARPRRAKGLGSGTGKPLVVTRSCVPSTGRVPAPSK